MFKMKHPYITGGETKYSNDGLLYVEGGSPLRGEVRVRGAKNSVPKTMVAAVLTDEPCRLTNVSMIRDVHIVGEIITAYRGEASIQESGVVEIDTSGLTPISAEESRRFSNISRIPILLCGPLLHRFGQVLVPNLGGCNIGSRPIDFHIQALRDLGAESVETPDGLLLKARRLRGAKIALPYPSVGATEQVLMAAVLAEGITELVNAAIEPEIIDLICVLQKMGAIIAVDVDRVVRITGVSRLRGFNHNSMPDRLEAASWACAAAATRGDILVLGARQVDMMAFLNTFRQLGGEFEVTEKGIRFLAKEALRPLVVETSVHPGFMTDWQQPLATTLTQATGVSIIHETVYEDRFGYVSELQRMGAQIQLHKECLGHSCRFGRRNHYHSAVIVGPTPLTAASISIPDLRAGFSYVIAALTAKGTSQISNIGLIERGYEDFTSKLVAVGAKVRQVALPTARANSA